MNNKYVYIFALGSNINNPEENLKKTIEEISHFFKITAKTELIRTLPEIVKNQPVFLNQGLKIETSFEPPEVLENLKGIEKKIGRIQRERYGPREIDIDIIWWSGGKYQSSDLTIPHPWNNARTWVRKILSELHPEGNRSYYKSMNVRSIKNIHDFRKKKENNEKIVMLTAYDYTSARILARTSVDVLLVGDSMGNVIYGYESTLKVNVDQMIYHGRAVKKGAPDKFTVIDMPFMSYHTSEDDAVSNAGKIIAQTGADAVKLEGGEDFIGVIKKIIRAGIPVMGHLGLMPQSVLRSGGYHVQGKNETDQKRMIDEAGMLEDAGVFSIVTEMIPNELGEKISSSVKVPVIGIGAGKGTDGQVLVFHDVLGANDNHVPKFVRKYMNMSEEVVQAVENFSHDVRTGSFPDEKEYFTNK